MSDHINAWATFEPPNGWSSFDQHEELSDAIWSGLTEKDGEWNYMNFQTGSSIWESCRDGSAILMWYEPQSIRLTELKVSPGVASVYMAPIIQSFGLAPQPDQPSYK